MRKKSVKKFVWRKSWPPWLELKRTRNDMAMYNMMSS